MACIRISKLTSHVMSVLGTGGHEQSVSHVCWKYRLLFDNFLYHMSDFSCTLKDNKYRHLTKSPGAIIDIQVKQCTCYHQARRVPNMTRVFRYGLGCSPIRNRWFMARVTRDTITEISCKLSSGHLSLPSS